MSRWRFWRIITAVLVVWLVDEKFGTHWSEHRIAPWSVGYSRSDRSAGGFCWVEQILATGDIPLGQIIHLCIGFGWRRIFLGENWIQVILSLLGRCEACKTSVCHGRCCCCHCYWPIWFVWWTWIVGIIASCGYCFLAFNVLDIHWLGRGCFALLTITEIFGSALRWH